MAVLSAPSDEVSRGCGDSGKRLQMVDYRLHGRDLVADWCFAVSAILNTPICWAGRLVFRSGCHLLNEGGERFGFFASREVERIMRVPYLIGGIVFGILGIPFACCGTALRGVGCFLQTKPFSVNGESEKIQERLSEDSFSLLWWNIAGIAGGISRFQGGLADWETRVQGLVNTIVAKNLDIVALTEVYDLSLQNVLEQQLRQHGYHLIVKNVGINANPLEAPSGLFLASKVALADIQFNAFPNERFEAKKGFLSCLFFWKKREVRLIVTHLKDSKQEEVPSTLEQARRHGEVSQIEQHVDRLSADANRIVLLAGDLNVVRDSMECQWLLARWKESEGERNLLNTYTNYGISRAGLGQPPEQREFVLDYVRLCQNASSQGQPKASVECGAFFDSELMLSDHRPLFARIG